MTKILFLLILSPFVLSSCDSDKEDRIDNILANTQWLSQADSASHTTQEYNDFDNQSYLEDILRICPELKYTIVKITDEDRIANISLCKKYNHTEHINASLVFDTEKCNFSAKKVEYFQMLKSNIKKIDYKFEGGSYIGNLGDNSFAQIQVESYGIYRASSSGFILVLPLDGNYTYTAISEKYDNKLEEEILLEENGIYFFLRNGNNISMHNQGKSFRGTLSDSRTQLNLVDFTQRYTLLKK